MPKCFVKYNSSKFSPTTNISCNNTNYAVFSKKTKNFSILRFFDHCFTNTRISNFVYRINYFKLRSVLPFFSNDINFVSRFFFRKRAILDRRHGFRLSSKLTVWPASSPAYRLGNNLFLIFINCASWNSVRIISICNKSVKVFCGNSKSACFI